MKYEDIGSEEERCLHDLVSRSWFCMFVTKELIRGCIRLQIKTGFLGPRGVFWKSHSLVSIPDV